MKQHSPASIHENSLYIHLVSTSQLLRSAQQIRHRVYVEEMGFEQPSPDRREMDPWDDFSMTCVAEHTGTGRMVGCVRVVDIASDSKCEQLPFEKNCLPSMHNRHTIQREHLGGRYGEISRLAVLPEFRRKPGDTKRMSALQHADNLTRLPTADEECHKVIALSLYLSSIALVDLSDMDMVFVMMERRLNRHLRLCGIQFEQLSDFIDYHGPRALFGRHPTELVRHFSGEVQELYELVKQNLAPQLKGYQQTRVVA